MCAIAGIMLCIAPAYGQALNADETTEAETVPFTLYIPGKMLSNSTYSGVVVLAEPSEVETTITLASTENDIDIPNFVTIPWGYNHGIFEMAFDEDLSGQIRIHAALSGDISTAEATIYATAESGTRLKIIGPSVLFDGSISTQVERLPFYVYVVNDNDIPIPAKNDMTVRLSASTESIGFVYGNNIHNDFFVSIPQGEYLATVEVDVKKSGIIYATSDGIAGDSEIISYGLDGADIRLEIAPNTAGTKSYVYYYVWLEKYGRQYIPEHLVEVAMSANNMTVGNFERDFSQKPGKPHNDYIINGVARGIVYTGSEGTVDITASVPQVGSTSTQLTVDDFHSEDGMTLEDIQTEYERCFGNEIVTWATFGNFTIIDTETCNFYMEVLGTINSAVPITTLDMLVYPDAPANNAFAVITPGTGITISDTITTETINRVNGTRTTEITSFERSATFPTTISHEADIVLNGDAGLVHNQIISAMNYHTGHFGLSDVSSMEVPIGIISDGRHRLSVHGKGITGSEATFTSESKYGEGESMHVMPLPIATGDDGDIAMVFLTDQSGSIVDFSNVISGDVTAHISQESDTIVNLTEDLVIMGSVGIVQGRYVDDDAVIFAHIPGFSSIPTEITTTESKPGGIEIWTPGMVHVTEKFPIAIHNVDTSGTPLGMPDDVQIASPLVYKSIHDGQRYMSVEFIGETDVIAVSEDGYLSSSTVDAFVNNVTDVTVKPIVNKENIRVGDEIVFDVLTGTIVNPIVDFIGGLNFMQNDVGQHVAIPTEAKTYDIIVQIYGNGTVLYQTNHTFVVREFVAVSYEVVTDDGVPIDADMTLTSVQLGENETAVTYPFPDGQAIDNVKPGLYGIKISESVELSDDRIYRLQDLDVNDEGIKFSDSFTMPIFEDVNITSTYVREIYVDTSNILDSEVESVLDNYETVGSGSYRYGDTVFLEAPILYEYGVIRHIPDEWNGLPGDAVISPDGTLARFEALDSVLGTVDYSRDYTILYGIVAAAVIAAPLIIRIRSPYVFADLFHNLKNLKVPKIPKIKGKNK